MRFIVVSGLSGAGKSIVMHALEDLGYYCVDNLPLALLPALAEELERTSVHEHAAVAIDARNSGADFEHFDEMKRRIEAGGVTCELLFLEADDDVLIERFSETRRRHPLTSGDVSLDEALQDERELLAPVRALAHLRIDTSHTHLHQLRDIVRQRIDRRPTETLSLQILSFGYKNGIPRDADLVFDVRCLPNPYWEPSLRHLGGHDEAVVRFLDAQPQVEAMFETLHGYLDRWVPAFEADNRAYLNVAIGCTGGRHRSVYMVERLGRHFHDAHHAVILRHRDLD